MAETNKAAGLAAADGKRHHRRTDAVDDVDHGARIGIEQRQIFHRPCGILRPIVDAPGRERFTDRDDLHDTRDVEWRRRSGERRYKVHIWERDAIWGGVYG